MIRKEIIFIVRAINYIATNRQYATKSAREDSPDDHRVKKIIKIDKILKDLKDHEKTSIMRIIKSGSLLTAGDVAAVRSPESFDSTKAKSWLSYLNELVINILTFYKITDIGDLQQTVTKQDYRDTNRMLPILGASSISDADAKIISKKYGLSKTDVVDTRKGAIGEEVTTLYRGLRDMSEKAIIRLTKSGSTWNLKRGVSTSFDWRTSDRFARKRGGYRILITIENKDRVGFQFDDLSRFEHEDEIIFSGNLIIKDDWELSYQSAPNRAEKYHSISSDGNTKFWTEYVEVTSNNAKIVVSVNGNLRNKIVANLQGDGHEMVKKLLKKELEIELKDPRIPAGKSKIKVGIWKDKAFLKVNTAVEK